MCESPIGVEDWSVTQFFQETFEGKENITYGFGFHKPRVPFIFQALEVTDPAFFDCCNIIEDDESIMEHRREAMKEIIDDFVAENITKAGHKYSCRLDGTQLSSETLVIQHIRQTHRSKIEDLLRVLAQDLTMEEDHLGGLFTKLFYCDFLYPSLVPQMSKLKAPSASSPEFPSALAPDLSKSEGRNIKKDKKKEARREITQIQEGMNALRKERKTILAKSIFSNEELMDIERKIFGDLRLPHDQQKQQQAQHSAQQEGQQFNVFSDLIVSTNEDEETRRKREAAIIAEAQNIKESTKPKPTNGSAKEATPPPATVKPAKQNEVKKPVPAAPKDEAPKVDQSKKEPIRLDKKQKKQLEEDLTAQILEEVLNDLSVKLANRAVQEVKKYNQQEREIEEHRVNEERKAKEEALAAAEKDRKVQERKNRREIRKQESEKFTELIADEIVRLECESIAKDVLEEEFYKRQQLLQAREYNQHFPPTHWSTPNPGLTQSYMPKMSKPERSFNLVEPVRPINIAKEPQKLNTVPLTAEATNGGYFRSKILPRASMYPQEAPTVYVPPMTAPSTSTANKHFGLVEPNDQPKARPSMTLADFIQDSATEDDLLPSFPSSNGDYEEEADEAIDETPSDVGLSYPMLSKDSIFSASSFSSFRTQGSVPNAMPPSPKPSPGMAPFSHLGNSSTPLSIHSSAPDLSVTPPMGANSRLLSSIPEDFGLNSKLSVVCRNIPVDFARKPEITSFFRECSIRLGSDFTSKIQFLKGADSGACFLEFETQEDVERALQKNGFTLGGNPIEVEKPIGLRTSETGQKFAFTFKTRNITDRHLADPWAPSQTSRENKLGGLNPVAPEFHPSTSPLPSSHSLSALLNTEKDTIVEPSRKTFTPSKAVGSKKNNLPTLKQLAQERVTPPQGQNASSLKSFFPLQDSSSNSGSVFNQSLFGTNMPIDNSNSPFSYGELQLEMGRQFEEDYEIEKLEGDLQFDLDLTEEKLPGILHNDSAEEAFMDRFS